MAVGADRLQPLPLFSALSTDALERFGRLFEARQVSPGTALTLEGASGYSFFVIEEGAVEVERSGEIVETLGKGDFFGEMAILSGERRNATVTATTQVDLLVLFGSDFRLLESEMPEAAEMIRQKMIERHQRAAS